MSRRNKLLFVLILTLLPLVSGQSCQDIGSFNQSNVQIEMQPNRDIEPELVIYDIRNTERPEMPIPLEHTVEDGVHTFIPSNTHLPRGNYTFEATLNYSVYKPSRCITFDVATQTATPWIERPSEQNLVRAKKGLIQNKTDDFTLKTQDDKTLTCKYTRRNNYEGDLREIYQDLEAPSITLSPRNTINWSSLLLDRSYTQGDVLPVHFYCEEQIGEATSYSFDTLLFVYLQNRPVITSFREQPGTVRSPEIIPDVDIVTNTPTYCYLKNDRKSTLQDSDFLKASTVSTQQTSGDGTSDAPFIRGDMYCEDLAGRVVNDSFEIDVDLSPQIRWDAPNVVGSSTAPVSALVSQYSYCAVSTNGQTTELDNTSQLTPTGFRVFNGTTPPLTPGKNNVSIRCVDDIGDKIDSITETVLYDNTPPELSINVSSEQCAWPNVEFKTQEMSDPQTQPRELFVEVVNPTDAEVLDSQTFTSLPIEPTEFVMEQVSAPANTSLQIRATLTDSVGNNITTTIPNIVLKSPDDTACDDIPPSIQIKNTFFPENTSNIYANITCADNRRCISRTNML